MLIFYTDMSSSDDLYDADVLKPTILDKAKLLRLRKENDRLRYGIEEYIDESTRHQERCDQDDDELEVAVACLRAMLCVEEEEFAACYRAFGEQLGVPLKEVTPWARNGAPSATYEPSYAFADIIVALYNKLTSPGSALNVLLTSPGSASNDILTSPGSALNPVDLTVETQPQAVVPRPQVAMKRPRAAPMEVDVEPPATMASQTLEQMEPQTLEEMEKEMARLREENAELEREFNQKLVNIPTHRSNHDAQQLSDVVSTLFLQDVPGNSGYASEDSYPNPFDPNMGIMTVELIAVGDYLKDLLVEFCPLYTALGKQLGVKAVKVCPSEGHFLGTCTPESYPLEKVLEKLAEISGATGRAAMPSFPALKM